MYFSNGSRDALHPCLPFRRVGRALACHGLVTVLTATAAFAQIAAGSTGIDASGNAQRERAACLSGNTQQDRATCLTEAQNANAAKRAGKVDNPGDAFAANALKRCDVFKDDDLAACRARVLGQDSAQGSVAGGGVIRQTETVVPAAGSATPPRP